MMRISPYAWTEKDMIGGNAALDFINTASKWSSGDPVDRLGGPAEFAVWAKAAGLLGDDDLALLERQLRTAPETAAATYKAAVELRAALWRIFGSVARGDAVDADDLRLLDQFKVRSARHCRLVQGADGAFRRGCCDDAPAMDRAIRQIVEAAETLLLDGPLHRIHGCGGEHCEWMFVDHSKNGRRRWCSMATCGNDAKVKKFRSRKNAA